jgi:UDP-N-acetylmuramoylalanine--D-glutamate ligase
MNLSKKRVIIVGLGKSGVAAARLCLARGAIVVGTDSAPAEKLSDEARGLGIEIVAGGHAGVDFAGADLVVVSPGVPDLPEFRGAKAPVIGEVELASRFLSAPIVAVGGTNGKSTTATLVADIFGASGKKTFAGANLGTPSCEAPNGDYDVVVFEVSSFQMERVPTFRPAVAVLLNISEDHLDRYSSFADYARAKGNGFANQEAADVAVVPAGDAACLEQAKRGRGRIVSFGHDGDYFVVGRSVVERSTGTSFSLEKAALHGRHNLDNAAAAIAAVRALGTDEAAIASGLASFRPLGHRMALVGETEGVRFYDDSKGTNVGAAVTALRGMEEARAVLIAGGRDKLGDYAPLVDALREKGRAAVLIGEAADRIAEAIGDVVPVERASSMTDAVEKAARLAKPGDAVLLSPACSSYDMFKSYAERGDRFVEAVKGVRA